MNYEVRIKKGKKSILIPSLQLKKWTLAEIDEVVTQQFPNTPREQIQLKLTGGWFPFTTEYVTVVAVMT